VRRPYGRVLGFAAVPMRGALAAFYQRSAAASPTPSRWLARLTGGVPDVVKVRYRSSHQQHALATERYRESDVEVGHSQRVGLNKLAPGFNLITHQRRENLVGGDGILDGDPEHAAHRGVHRGLP